MLKLILKFFKIEPKLVANEPYKVTNKLNDLGDLEYAEFNGVKFNDDEYILAKYDDTWDYQYGTLIYRPWLIDFDNNYTNGWYIRDYFGDRLPIERFTSIKKVPKHKRNQK